jgi:hypothetical protein
MLRVFGVGCDGLAQGSVVWKKLKHQSSGTWMKNIHLRSPPTGDA